MAALPYKAVRPALEANEDGSYVTFGSGKVNAGAQTPPGDPDDDTNVTLSPWRHEWLPLVIAVAALLIQAAVFGTGIWLAVDPVVLPSSNYVVGGVSLKSFNVIITVLGSIISGIAGAAVSAGARSRLSKALVQSGITLKEYERWFAIGNGATVSLTSTNGLVPLAMFVLAGAASGAINGIFAAATDETTTSRINLLYNSVPDSLTTLNGLGLYNRQDFEGFVFNFRQNVLLRQPPNATVTDVDGVRAGSIANGIAPTIYEISTLTSRILVENGPGAFLNSKTRRVIGEATANEYTFSAPTAQATFTCDSGTTMFSPATSVEGGFVTFTLTDPNCGTSSAVFANVDNANVGAYACVQNSKAFIGYYSVNAHTSEFKALASCSGTVVVGTASGMKYWDSQIGTPSSYNLSHPFTLANPTDYSATAVKVLSDNWISSFGTTGSTSLSDLLGTPRYTQDLSLVSGTAYYDALAALSQGLMAMSLAKLLNSASIFTSYFNGTLTNPADTASFATTVQSPSIIIGPIGLNKLWLVVLGLTLATLVQSLVFVIRYRPTPLNPLDPVSVLLVAQNSPPTHFADGGCLGARDQIRAPDEVITYRAVNAVHLAFVWGTSYYEPPVVGRMYGKVGKQE